MWPFYPPKRKEVTESGHSWENKSENHFSPYPRLRKKLAINCGRTAEELPDNQHVATTLFTF
jgi:hypothetical protein